MKIITPFKLFLIGPVLVLSIFTSCRKEDKAQSPGTNEVYMQSTAFNPATLTVSAGATVTWTNKENTTHTVTSDNGAFTSSSDINNSQTYQQTFSTPGSYPYHCSKHNGMTGTVVVQ